MTLDYTAIMDKMIRYILGEEIARYAAINKIDVPVVSPNLEKIYNSRYIGIDCGSNFCSDPKIYHIVMMGTYPHVPSRIEFINYIDDFENAMELLKIDVKRKMLESKKQDEEEQIKEEILDKKLLEIYARYND